MSECLRDAQLLTDRGSFTNWRYRTKADLTHRRSWSGESRD
jgi:hypothetical protein